jgi:phosphoserine phosphatase RsbU/P
VSGKGVPAALLMARLSGEARVSMLTQPNVAAALTHLNEQLMQANLEDRYVTLSAAVIDPKTHRVDLVSAGHLSPWLYRRGTQTFEKVFEKDTGDFPVGWVPGHTYTAYPVQLEPGDSLLVYTDGIEDAQPASGQRFTEDGVRREMAAIRDSVEVVTARELGARIVQSVQTHAGNHPQFDDIALVCYGRAVGGESEPGTGERPTPRV